MSYDESKNAFSIVFVCEHIFNVDVVFWGKQGKTKHLTIKFNINMIENEFQTLGLI